MLTGPNRGGKAALLMHTPQAGLVQPTPPLPVVPQLPQPVALWNKGES